MTERHMSEMVRNRRPLTIPPATTVADACKQMFDRRVGAVLVTDSEDGLVGIFTGRDAVRMLAQGTAANCSVQEVMTRDPCAMAPGSTAIEALRLMEDGGFRHVPVVDGGRVVGVVSWGDFRDSEHDRLETEVGLWERI